MPLDLILFRLMFNVLRQPSSVSSPYKRSSLFLTNERCSCFKNEKTPLSSCTLYVKAYRTELGSRTKYASFRWELVRALRDKIRNRNNNQTRKDFTSFNSLPISSGISVRLVLSNLSHCIPVMRRTDSGNLPPCKDESSKQSLRKILADIFQNTILTPKSLLVKSTPRTNGNTPVFAISLAIQVDLYYILDRRSCNHPRNAFKYVNIYKRTWHAKLPQK